MVTTVQVSENTWERLDERRDRGDSFDDVITEILNKEEENAE